MPERATVSVKDALWDAYVDASLLYGANDARTKAAYKAWREAKA